jgi:hypothetical protein
MDKKSVIFILGLIFIKDWKYGVNPENQETMAVKDYYQDPNLAQSQPIEKQISSDPIPMEDAHIEFQQIFKPEILPTEEPFQSKSTQRKLDNGPRESLVKRIFNKTRVLIIGVAVFSPAAFAFFSKKLEKESKISNPLSYSAQTSKIITFFNDKTIKIRPFEKARITDPEVKQEFQIFFYNKVINNIFKIKEDVVDFSKIESIINPYNKLFNKLDEQTTGFDLIKALVYLRFNDYLKLNINCYPEKEVEKFIKPLEDILGWLFKMFDPNLYNSFDFEKVENGIVYFTKRLIDSPLLSFLSFVVSETAVSQYKNPEVLKKLIDLCKKITNNEDLMRYNISHKFNNNQTSKHLTLTIQLNNEIENSSKKTEKTIEIFNQFEKHFDNIAKNKTIVPQLIDKAQDLKWK